MPLVLRQRRGLQGDARAWSAHACAAHPPTLRALALGNYDGHLRNIQNASLSFPLTLAPALSLLQCPPVQWTVSGCVPAPVPAPVPVPRHSATLPIHPPIQVHPLTVTHDVHRDFPVLAGSLSEPHQLALRFFAMEESQI